jgi:uncharacterized phiE125 gp8 family phage protein
MKSPYSPIQIAAPSVTPVSLADAKAQLRVEHDQENSLITLWIEAATAHLDGYAGTLGRCLIDQTWAEDFDGFEKRLSLVMPVRTITSLTYIDAGGSTQTLSSSLYELGTDPAGSYIRLKSGQSWPITGSGHPVVRVTYVSGYGATSASVPAPIRAAIMMLVSSLYENRQAESTAPLSIHPAVERLLLPYRWCLAG